MPSGMYQHYKGGIYRLLLHGYITSSFGENLAPLLRAALSEERGVRLNVGMNWDTGRVEAWLPQDRRHADYPNHVCYPDGCPVVLYASLSTRQFWLRPLSMWSELVLWPSGEEKSRFSWLGHDLPSLP